MTDGTEERREALVDTATEAERRKHRQAKEEAILSLIARDGLDAPEGLRRRAAGLSWSRKDYGAIHEALVAVMDKGVPITDILVDEALDATGVKVGDEVLKGILTAEAPDLLVAEEYLKDLEHQDRTDRAKETVKHAGELIAGAKTEADLDAGIDGLLDLIHRKKIVREYRTEGDEDEVRGFLDTLAGRRKGKGTGLDFGGGDLDKMNGQLGGLNAALYVLAGAPSTGKTTLAKQIADNVAETGTPVIYWHYEQGPYEMRVKTLARKLQANLNSINTEEEDGGTPWRDILAAMEDYQDKVGPWMKIIRADITDSIDRIRQVALVEWHKAGRRPILLVLDYLQIIPPAQEKTDTGIRERVDSTLSELRRLAGDIQSPVLVISSLNRDGYRKDIEPSLTSMKESGGIEYSADVIICLYQDCQESEILSTEYQRETRRVKALILKNRVNGYMETFLLDFTPSWATFTEAYIPGERIWSKD